MLDSQFQFFAFVVLCIFQWGLFLQGTKLWIRSPAPRSWILGALSLALCVVLIELGGGRGVAVGRVFYASGMLLGMIQILRSRRVAGFKVIPWSLFLIHFGFWTWLMRDLAFLSSVDDGVNHLFFYTRIRETLHAFTPHIPLLRSDQFGAHFLGYYPSGFHALTAVFSYPASLILNTNPLTELKGMSLIVLGYFPVALFLGIRWVCGGLGIWPAALAAIWAGFIQIFPLNAMGEGGISRVVGHVLAIPIVWELIRGPLSFKECLGLGIAVFPVFFWIHPASGVVIGLVFAVRVLELLISDQRSRLKLTLGCLIGALGGGALIWAMLHARTVGEQTSFLSQRFFSEPLLLSWRAWIDRMKGPVHFLFSDSAGFGKFFSPRSLLADFGMIALFFIPEFKKLRRYLILWLLLPFALAALLFSSFPPFVYLGLLFYHSVKRISELGFWPLYLGWVVGFFVLVKLNRGLIAIFFISVIFVSGRRIDLSLQEFDRTFRSLSPNALAVALERFDQVDTPNSLWLCSTPDFQPIVSIKSLNVGSRIYFPKGTECNSTPSNVEYCQKESEFLNLAIQNGASKWIALNDQGQGCTQIHIQDDISYKFQKIMNVDK